MPLPLLSALSAWPESPRTDRGECKHLRPSQGQGKGFPSMGVFDGKIGFQQKKAQRNTSFP